MRGKYLRAEPVAACRYLARSLSGGECDWFSDAFTNCHHRPTPPH
jgi:hypothetical protein